MSVWETIKYRFDEFINFCSMKELVLVGLGVGIVLVSIIIGIFILMYKYDGPAKTADKIDITVVSGYNLVVTPLSIDDKCYIIKICLNEKK